LRCAKLSFIVAGFGQQRSLVRELFTITSD
jgi:hypothetical protein